MEESKQEFKQSLSLMDATMIVAGSMIGSGIFIVSADIIRHVGGAGNLILVWIITGIMTMAAAVSYGELSGMYPKAGGQYVYLTESWNKLIGFLYGWTLFMVIQTGTIAAVGVAFAKFAGYFFPVFELTDQNLLATVGPFKLYYAQLLSIAIICFLTYINSLGVNGGKIIQTIFTSTKLIALFGIILLGFILGYQQEVWNTNWANMWDIHQSFNAADALQSPAIPIVGLFAAAMVGSVFSSDAWNNITFIAGEVKNPKRNIGLALLLGTGIVTLLYILTNVMYTGVLQLPEIANAPQDRVAVAAAEKILGVTGTKIIALLIMVSTFGCINGMILAGSRVYYTMAKDKLFFKQVNQLNKNQVPSNALWIQCIWASLLCLSGRYGDLLDYVVFAVLIFYILTILGIFRLRKTQPNIERPYKAFGYPWLPAIYVILASVMGVCLLIWKPNYTLPGLGIVLLGIPVYYFTQKNKTD
jgi:APA family basic amino acid/polyamine antiporter